MAAAKWPAAWDAISEDLPCAWNWQASLYLYASPRDGHEPVAFDASCDSPPKIFHLNSYGAWKASVPALERRFRNRSAYAHNLRVAAGALRDATYQRLCDDAERQVAGLRARACSAEYLLARHALLLEHPDRIPHWNREWHGHLPKIGLLSLWHRYHE